MTVSLLRDRTVIRLRCNQGSKKKATTEGHKKKDATEARLTCIVYQVFVSREPY